MNNDTNRHVSPPRRRETLPPPPPPLPPPYMTSSSTTGLTSPRRDHISSSPSSHRSTASHPHPLHLHSYGNDDHHIEVLMQEKKLVEQRLEEGLSKLVSQSVRRSRELPPPPPPLQQPQQPQQQPPAVHRIRSPQRVVGLSPAPATPTEPAKPSALPKMPLLLNDDAIATSQHNYNVKYSNPPSSTSIVSPTPFEGMLQQKRHTAMEEESRGTQSPDPTMPLPPSLEKAIKLLEDRRQRWAGLLERVK
eukprot:PhF_6_TR3335/c0_g1_i3/m.4712